MDHGTNFGDAEFLPVFRQNVDLERKLSCGNTESPPCQSYFPAQAHGASHINPA